MRTTWRMPAELRDIVDRMGDDSKGDSVTINQLERDLTVKTSQAEAWRKEYEKVKEEADELSPRCRVSTTTSLSVLQKYSEDKEARAGATTWMKIDKRPTMPVIPKAVAIAIFREGVQSGVNDAVTELEGQSINIDESEYCGDFEVAFTKDIDLDDELDLDWMRDKIG